MPIKNQRYQSIIDYCNIISLNPQNASCIEYLFNILKQIGLISMSQGEIDEKLLNRVKELFYNTLQTSDTHAPSFINFDDLNQEANQFISISIEPHPRVPMHNTEAVSWEEKWEDVIEFGMRLIENGLMIKAVYQGENILGLSACKTNEELSNTWSESWQKFKKKSVLFINKLINKKNIEKFFILSDDVLSLLAEYAFIPEDNFQKFLYNIAAPKENYAENHNYRKLFTANEAKELFEQVKKKYQNHLNVSLAYTFEAAMAQKAIKNFILNNCCLLESAGYSNYGKLLTNFDIDTGSETPFIVAGNKLFTNHITISDGFLSGWGVRKDDDAIKSLNQRETDFSGALFCSLKQYPNGAWTISFDSYKNKEQFYKLIAQGDEYFVRLPYEQIFNEDKREEFLQEAANAVMGISIENDVLALLIKDVYIKTIAQNFFQHLIAAGVFFNAIQRTYKKKSLTVAQGTGPSTPETNILHIPLNVSEHQNKEIDLLPSALKKKPVIKSIDTEQRKIYDSIVDFIDGNSSWHYFAYTLDDKGEVLSASNKKGNIGTNKKIKYRVNKGAQMIFLCIAPEETINKVSQMFDESPDMASVPDENDNIIWLIYGASKKNSSK